MTNQTTFLTSVYLTLVLGLIFTFATFHFIKKRVGAEWTQRFDVFILTALLSLALVFILSLVKMSMITKLSVFLLLSIVNGLMLSTVSYYSSDEMIKRSMLGTIALFIVLSVVGFITAYMKINLSWMGGMLLACLIGLIIAMMVSMFFKGGSLLEKSLLTIGLVLFSVLVVYQTNLMMQKDYHQDFVSGAVDLYLSFLNIFVRY